MGKGPQHNTSWLGQVAVLPPGFPNMNVVG